MTVLFDGWLFTWFPLSGILVTRKGKYWEAYPPKDHTGRLGAN